MVGDLSFIFFLYLNANQMLFIKNLYILSQNIEITNRDSNFKYTINSNTLRTYLITEEYLMENENNYQLISRKFIIF